MKYLSSILGVTLASVVAFASANAEGQFPVTEGIDWSGPYAGVHIGGGWGNLNTNDVNGIYGGNLGQAYGNDFGIFFGGVQAGYNFQYGNFVIGPEVDLGGIGASNKVSHVSGTIGDSFDGGFYADVTGRIGFSVGQGLLYAKGGYIYLDGSESHFDTVAPASTASKSGLDGWTLGGGYEYKISPSLSVKGEYMHSDFGINTLYDTSASSPIKDGLTVDTAKVGVNYFFNSGYVPLK